MKILSSKEYKRLKDIEEKYRWLTGQTITLCTGARSRYSTLLSMEKEEIVRRYFDLNKYAIELQKKIIK